MSSELARVGKDTIGWTRIVDKCVASVHIKHRYDTGGPKLHLKI